MWFKTRVGLINIETPIQILGWRYPQSGNWCIYARLDAEPERQGRHLFGKIAMRNATFTLACFHDSSAVAAEMGEAMLLIAEAAASRQALCDLSQVGSAAAWDKAWIQVAWPGR